MPVKAGSCRVAETSLPVAVCERERGREREREREGGRERGERERVSERDRECRDRECRKEMNSHKYTHTNLATYTT